MRILFLVNAPRARLTGAASQTLALASALITNGEHVSIAGQRGSALERASLERGVSFHPVAFRATPWDLMRLTNVIRRERPDVVHAMSVVPLVLARPRVLAASGPGRGREGLFATIHVDPTSPLVFADGKSRPRAARFRNRLLRRVAPGLDCLFLVSGAILAELEAMGVAGRKVVVGAIVDATDLAKRRREPVELPAGRPRIGSAVGQLERLKGVDHLLRAFAALSTEYPEAACLIAGEGTEREALTLLAAELGVRDRVHLMGYIDDPAAFIGSLDVYVSPSLSEGLGVALAEALALGVPAVATDVGGTRDVVIPGRTGLIVPPADSSAMAGAIRQLLGNPERAHRMAREAAADAGSRFGPDRVLDVTLAEYRRAIERRAG